MPKKQKTYFFDAQDEILGRLAAKIAVILRGKHQPDFLPYILNIDKVIIYNTNKLKFNAKKLDQKKYHSHSGYPGALKERTLRSMMTQDSSRVLRQAVWGMLPKNRLRSKLIKNLIIFKLELPPKYAKEVNSQKPKNL